MKKKIILLSGLPRSGSTLLGRIFSQNPKFYASPSSPLIDILINTRNNWETPLEHKATPNKNLKPVLKAIVDAYYENTQQPIVIDKSRTHNAYIDLWEHILEEKPKVLITIRDIADIICSLEKLHRKTTLVRQPPFEREFYWQMQHLEGRAAVWTSPEQIIGLAYSRITDAIARHPECLHFINFDNLTKNPEETMKKAYKFLGEEYYEHDFNNVPTYNPENDAINGYVDLHETRAKVLPVISDARKILGDGLVHKYNQFNLHVLYPFITAYQP